MTNEPVQAMSAERLDDIRGADRLFCDPKYTERTELLAEIDRLRFEYEHLLAVIDLYEPERAKEVGDYQKELLRKTNECEELHGRCRRYETALEWYAGSDPMGYMNEDFGKRAREALKETGE